MIFSYQGNPAESSKGRRRTPLICNADGMGEAPQLRTDQSGPMSRDDRTLLSRSGRALANNSRRYKGNLVVAGKALTCAATCRRLLLMANLVAL